MRKSTEMRHSMIVDAYYQIIAELKSTEVNVCGKKIDIANSISRNDIYAMVCEKVKITNSEDFVRRIVNAHLNSTSSEEYNNRLEMAKEALS